MNQKEIKKLAKVEVQVTSLQSEVGDIKQDIKKIMRNELPHLRLLINEKITKLSKNLDKRIDKLDRKVVILWAVLTVIATIGGNIANHLISKYL